MGYYDRSISFLEGNELKNNKIKFDIRQFSLFIIVIVVALFLFIIKPEFRSSINIFGILYSISVNSIIIGAMTVLYISGGFDMSVGSTLGLSGIVLGLLLVSGIPYIFAILITIFLGMSIGAITGYIISYLDANPFIVTLAGWFVIGALIFIVGKGTSISGIPKSFSLIATYKIFNIPMIIIFSTFSIIIFVVLLRTNVFFRQSYYIGGNEKAAMLVGIKVKKVKLFFYILTSTMASIASIFLTARFSAAYNNAGYDSAFQIITAVLIGGASLKGGKGSVVGSFLGLILVALVYDAIVLFNVNINWYKVVIGLTLVIAVLLNSVIQKENK